MKMEVRCYDCGRLISQGEAIKTKEGKGNFGGVGYGNKNGWGVGGGNWGSAGKSYWLCIACDRKRVENQRFWQLVILVISLVGILVAAIVYFVVENKKIN